MENINQQRGSRLRSVLRNPEGDYNLLIKHKIECVLFKQIYGCVIDYINASMYAYYGSTVHEISCVEDFREHTKNLPNITPNGLIMPKIDNYLEYNRLHKSVAKLMEQATNINLLQSIHFPINIRVAIGGTTNDRPHASTKLHSDIWAGELANSLMFFIGIGGDTKNVGVEFYEPKDSFYPEYVRKLEDFTQGSHLIDSCEKYDCGLEQGYLFLTDPFLLHRTIKRSYNIRVSIDFRAIPVQNLDSDINLETGRVANYIPNSDWLSVGTDKVLYSRNKLSEIEKTSIGMYPSSFELVELNERRNNTSCS